MTTARDRHPAGKSDAALGEVLDWLAFVDELPGPLEVPPNVVENFRHEIRDVEVVISCSCGRCFHGETEAYAIEEWEAH